MIIGIGTDLCDIRRIEKTLERFGDKFTHRVFSGAERKKAARRANPASTFALCYAAKEAGSKALGTGFRDGVLLKDFAIDNLPSGQPVLTLTGGAAARLKSLLPGGTVPRVHVSLTDEYPMAQAMVVIEAHPDTGQGA